jgi:hypothetical protein
MIRVYVLDFYIFAFISVVQYMYPIISVYMPWFMSVFHSSILLVLEKGNMPSLNPRPTIHPSIHANPDAFRIVNTHALPGGRRREGRELLRRLGGKSKPGTTLYAKPVFDAEIYKKRYTLLKKV